MVLLFLVINIVYLSLASKTIAASYSAAELASICAHSDEVSRSVCGAYLIGVYEAALSISHFNHSPGKFCIDSGENPPQPSLAIWFDEWFASHPQHVGATAVSSIFAMLMDRYPCGRPSKPRTALVIPAEATLGMACGSPEEKLKAWCGNYLLGIVDASDLYNSATRLHLYCSTVNTDLREDNLINRFQTWWRSTARPKNISAFEAVTRMLSDSFPCHRQRPARNK
jgi:hypothetical protein